MTALVPTIFREHDTRKNGSGGKPSNEVKLDMKARK